MAERNVESTPPEYATTTARICASTSIKSSYFSASELVTADIFAGKGTTVGQHDRRSTPSPSRTVRGICSRPRPHGCVHAADRRFDRLGGRCPEDLAQSAGRRPLPRRDQDRQAQRSPQRLEEAAGLIQL